MEQPSNGGDTKGITRTLSKTEISLCLCMSYVVVRSSCSGRKEIDQSNERARGYIVYVKQSSNNETIMKGARELMS
eukprot:19182-Heterococcus_DN1.PRE.11